MVASTSLRARGLLKEMDVKERCSTIRVVMANLASIGQFHKYKFPSTSLIDDVSNAKGFLISGDGHAINGDIGT